jgi:serine/threonine protein kinase
VKTYKLTAKDYEPENKTPGLTAEQLIINEIRFLRELKVCNNIVNLESVYTRIAADTQEKHIIMVMRLAKDGSLL